MIGCVKKPLKAFEVYDGSIGVYPCEVNRLIDEAEAKWEAEDIPIIHGKAELALHDKVVRSKAYERFAEKIRDWQKEVYKNDRYLGELDFLFKHIYEIAEQLKEE